MVIAAVGQGGMRFDLDLWALRATVLSGALPCGSRAHGGSPATSGGHRVLAECPLSLCFHSFFPQTGTVGVLNSYYNGSMDKMIWGHDLTPADPQSLEGQHDLTPADPQPLEGQHDLTPADPQPLDPR